ncbi:MAG: hypothetical protein AB8C84_12070 [Oligoflexales bacterium]
MIPFRVFDPHKKTTWIILNFHQSTGEYLVAREDDSDEDGTILTLTVNDLKTCQMIDFVDSED